jgi:hypothetical protein
MRRLDRAYPLLATCLGTDVLTPRAPSLPPAWHVFGINHYLSSYAIVMMKI